MTLQPVRETPFFSRLIIILIMGLFCLSLDAKAQLCALQFTQMDEDSMHRVRNYLTSREAQRDFPIESIFYFQQAFKVDSRLKDTFNKLGFEFTEQQTVIPTWLTVYKNYIREVSHIPADKRILPALALQNESSRKILFFRPGLDPWPQDGNYLIHTGSLSYKTFVRAVSNGMFPTNFSGLHDISHLVGFLTDPDNYMTTIRRLFEEKADIEDGKAQVQGEYRELHFVTELLSLPHTDKHEDVLDEINFNPKALDQPNRPDEVIEIYKATDWHLITQSIQGIQQRTTGLIGKFGGIVAHPPEAQSNLEYMVPVILNKLIDQDIYPYSRLTGDEMAYNSISFVAAELEYLLALWNQPESVLQQAFPQLNLKKNQIEVHIRESLARYHWALWYGSKNLSMPVFMNEVFFSKSPDSHSVNYIRGLRGESSRLFRILTEL